MINQLKLVAFQHHDKKSAPKFQGIKMKVYRFAPSPTGFLHVGGARTAIFNWLLAQKNKGKFLLRIEDTDAKRSLPEYTDQILSSLKWLGLTWDIEPIFQSQKKNRYLEVAHSLLKTKKAYYCFCTPEILKKKREYAEKNKLDFVYDKTCLSLSDSDIKNNLDKKQPYTIRLKTNEGLLSFNDQIMGQVENDIRLIGDFIIVRSDGNPVYQLAVVVDDFDMGITEVIRGADHLANTAKQILILKALDWVIPNYGHLPLILGPDKKRLSKRHGATSVEEFKNQGYLPDALFNYLCLLGWSAGDDRELYKINELIDKFDLESVNKSNAIFDESKLKWMNAKYITEKSPKELLLLSADYNKYKNEMSQDELQSVEKLAELVKLRAENLNDFESRMFFFYRDPESYNKKGIRKYFTPETPKLLQNVLAELEKIDQFQPEHIEIVLRNMAENLNLSAAKLIHPLRLALTGDIASPGIFEIVEILGKAKLKRRINNAIQFIQSL